MVFKISFYEIILSGFGLIVIVAVFNLLFRKRASSRKFQSLFPNRDYWECYAKELLKTNPDGVCLWSYPDGNLKVNNQLAKMFCLDNLDLPKFEYVLSKFKGRDLEELRSAVTNLRKDSLSFDILVFSSETAYQVTGTQAKNHRNMLVADVVWFRLVHGKVETLDKSLSSNLGDQHLISALDALPLPIWIRDESMKITFQNACAEKVNIKENYINCSSKTTNELFPGESFGFKQSLKMTELPLTAVNSRGIIGVGIPSSDKAPVSAIEVADINTILKSIDVAVCIFNFESTLVNFNDAFVNIWGLDSKWLIEKPKMYDYLVQLRNMRNLPEVADFSEFFNDEISKLSAKKPGNDMLHLPDGRAIGRRWNPDGHGGLVFSFEDLSGKLLLERSVKSFNAVQRTTIDHLTEAIAVFGEDGRLSLFNPEFQKAWGLNPEVIYPGVSAQDLVDAMRPVLPVEGEWAKPSSEVAAMLLSRKLQSGRLGLTHGQIMKYAHIPLPDGASLISYVDITDSTRVEEALRDRARALAEADQLKSEFIANVSYEIRTPLNTIIGFSEMLGEQYFGKLNQRQHQYASGIVETSRSLMKIVSDIMELASIEAGFIKLDLESIDLHALLAGSLGLIREKAKKNSIKIEFDCAPNAGIIFGDEKKLSQVIFNLLSNAVNFSQKHATIVLRGKRVENKVEIAVIDSGIGILKRDREQILRPFGVGEGSKVGVGLGLTLVRSFVNLHNGSVTIASNSKRGTTVRCILPVDPRESEEHTQ